MAAEASVVVEDEGEVAAAAVVEADVVVNSAGGTPFGEPNDSDNKPLRWR